jgi:predicted RNA-binding protein
MCQMRIVLKRDDHEEILMENVASVAVEDGGIRAASLLEEPRRIPGVKIQEIDCLESRIVLAVTGEAN